MSLCGCCRSAVPTNAEVGAYVRPGALWLYELCTHCAKRAAERPDLVSMGVRRTYERYRGRPDLLAGLN